MTLKDNLSYWQALGTNTMVCDWIDHGVRMDMNDVPLPFKQRQRSFNEEEF